MSEGKKEILLGDCLELMKDIPNGSIDMILCDLPYGTTFNHWDIVIPFNELWKEYERIIKINGAIVLFGAEPFSSKLRLSNDKIFKYDWIWDTKKTSSPFLAKKRPLIQHQVISVFYQKQPTYNPQDYKKNTIGLMSNKKTPHRSKNFNNNENNSCGLIDTKGDNKNEFGYPRSIINQIPVMNNLSLDKSGLHPTQKPTALFEYLIKTYTNENDLVLDNTAGSGTTAIACLNTNRQFIVMEKEQKYYDIILKRVGDFNKKFETQTLFGNEM